MWRIARPDAVAVLEDEAARKSLRRYFAVMQDLQPAKFIVAKRLSANFADYDSLDQLWEEHRKVADEFGDFEREVDSGMNVSELLQPKISFLDLKAKIASRIVESCRLCARECGVNRLARGLSYCGCGRAMAVSSIFAHMGKSLNLFLRGLYSRWVAQSAAAIAKTGPLANGERTE